MTPAERMASAFELRQSGKRAESASLACSLLETTEWYRALELAAVNFIELRSFPELANILQLADMRGYGAPLLFSRVLDNCLRTDQFDLIEDVAQRSPREAPLHVIGVYYVGCVRVVRHDAGAALAVFEYFRSIVGDYVSRIPFGTDRDLNVLYRQGILVAAPAEVQRRLAAAAELPAFLRDFTLVERARPSRTLVCACADARYAARFARDLFASIGPEDALHLHVVDPLPETLLLFRELSAAGGPGRFGASTSRDPNYGTATAYACARFFVLPLLLREYRRPIVTVDIDVRVTDRLASLDLASASFDFGCFETVRREPSSVYIAILMVMFPTQACQDFLEALSGFCQYALKMSISGNWLLDQAALYSVKHYFSVGRPDFQFQVLNGPTGGTALDFVTLVTTDEEKYDIRNAVSTPRTLE
jgi:hypothetical protein